MWTLGQPYEKSPLGRVQTRVGISSKRNRALMRTEHASHELTEKQCPRGTSGQPKENDPLVRVNQSGELVTSHVFLLFSK